MNHLLIAILISLALLPQSDRRCTAKCERVVCDVEDLADIPVQDPEDVDADVDEIEIDEIVVDVGQEMEDVERAVREAAEAAEQAAEEAADAAEQAAEEAADAAEQAAEEAAQAAEEAAEEAMEAAERAADDAVEAAERAAEEAGEAAERAADEAVEAAERAAEEAEAAAGRYHQDAQSSQKRQCEVRAARRRDCSPARAECVQDSLKATQEQLRELVATARSGQGSSCGTKNKRGKEIAQKEMAQVERALAALAHVQDTDGYKQAMELAKDQGALAQVLAVKGAGVSQATQEQLDLLSSLGYTSATSRPSISTREDAQSRSLEDRIHALEQRLGVEDGDEQSLEKRVEELERRLENAPRIQRQSPGMFTKPRAIVVPRTPGQTFLMPGTPSAPRAVTVAPRGKKSKSKSSAHSAPEAMVEEDGMPVPPAPPEAYESLSPLGGLVAVTPRAPMAPTPNSMPVPPSPPSPSDDESPAMILRRSGPGGQGFNADRRREIETMMQRMREEMEHLRNEMDRLRDDLRSSAQGGRTR